MSEAPSKPAPVLPPRQPGGSFARSLAHAWAGLLHTVVHQRNMRLHVLAAMLVAQVGAGIPLGLAEKVTLIFCVLLIFFAEILNSALEHLVDLATEALHEKARVAKDASAAGVLVLAVGIVVVFAALLVHNAQTIASHVEQIQRQVLVGVPLTLCVGVLMHERPRPGWVNLVVFLAGLSLQGYALLFTASYVFGAMSAGLLWLAFRAGALRLRQT